MALWATLAATGIEGYGAMLGRPLTESEVEPLNWAQADHARKVSGVDYANAVAATAEFRRVDPAVVGRWLGPAVDTHARRASDRGRRTVGGRRRRVRADAPGDAFVPFTPLFNVSGQPAINVPLRWNDEGLPIGVQLVAAYGREDVFIRVASQLEQAQTWAQRSPCVGGGDTTGHYFLVLHSLEFGDVLLLAVGCRIASGVRGRGGGGGGRSVAGWRRLGAAAEFQGMAGLGHSVAADVAGQYGGGVGVRPNHIEHMFDIHLAKVEIFLCGSIKRRCAPQN